MNTSPGSAMALAAIRHDACLLRGEGLTKRYGGVTALNDVSVGVAAGEVVAIVGENGAGKSTLMKIFAGVQTPDAGRIFVDGRPVRLGGVRPAQQLGIVLIHQELNLAENLDVTANIVLGREPAWLGGLLIDHAAARAVAQNALARVGLDVPPGTRVGELSVGRRQLVEIARALAIEARVLILDEPTSSLSAHETATLLRVIGELRQRGVGVLYISHRLAEVTAVADRVVVLRDGTLVGELTGSEIKASAMVALMVGRSGVGIYQRQKLVVTPPTDSGAVVGAVSAAATTTAPREARVVLDIESLQTAAYPAHAVSLRVRAGEIVGLAGLVGAGRTELIEAVFGITYAKAGVVRVDGQAVPPGQPRASIAAGLALVPEDRKAHGLLTSFSVLDNLALPNWGDRAWPAGLVRTTHHRAVAAALISAWAVRPPDPDKPVAHLSGGNQQKVALAKWQPRQPKVLLLDEPTRGVDIAAREEIYRLIETQAARGTAVVIVSSDLAEIMALCDRVLVMTAGRVAGELSREAFSEQAIMTLATSPAGSVSARFSDPIRSRGS